MTEKFWYLKHCQLFARLNEEAIRRVERSSRIRRLDRGTPVYLPADAADGVLLLVDGRIKICHLTPDGKQSILAFIEPGEIFGELALFDGETRDEYAESVEPSQIILIPKVVFQQLMEQHSDVSLGITRLVGLRRKRIERRLKYLLFRSNRDRLVHLLLELAEEYGRAEPDGIALGIKLSHQEMASIIGSTRETVTVLLGELQHEQLIQLARRRVKVCDLERLAAAVSAPAPRLRRDEKGSERLPSYG